VPITRAIRTALLFSVLLAWTAASCAAKLPPDPGLATEDLGIGIRLGMEPADAKSAAELAPDKVEVWVITREELNTRNPYADRPADRDLVVALYVLPGTMGYTSDDPVAAGKISELRCYLTDPADSQLTLLGHAAAALGQNDVIELCGPSEETAPSSDGNTHLRYEFQPDDSALLGKYNLDFVASLNPADNCFAFAIALEPRS
jgi:hypothetical protein